TASTTITAAVFTVSAVLLFGTSAIYHRGTWSPPVAAVLRRLDHASIFLLISGTYTPLAVILLPPSTATVLLVVVWVGALGGILARVFWMHAPRWFYVPIYLALGWVAVWFLPAFYRTGGSAVLWLVMVGGLAYTLGALVYALKWPNPSPRWFGFHEIFHVGTVIGYVCHFIAVAVATFSVT
ncbi:hemolysin III family protein, partial [Georgenia sp. 10Sc9-8]|nr:hemolysin III family protein [Georgenia halotolerans]